MGITSQQGFTDAFARYFFFEPRSNEGEFGKMQGQKCLGIAKIRKSAQGPILE